MQLLGVMVFCQFSVAAPSLRKGLFISRCLALSLSMSHYPLSVNLSGFTTFINAAYNKMKKSLSFCMTVHALSVR